MISKQILLITFLNEPVLILFYFILFYLFIYLIFFFFFFFFLLTVRCFHLFPSNKNNSIYY